MPPILVVTAPLLGLMLAMARDGQEVKFADCPPAVRKALQAEAKGAKIDVVTREDEDEGTVYWADAAIGGKMYAIGVLEDGTLTEMNLAVDENEIPIERCPGAVQATFRGEAFGEKIESVGQDMKYGVTVYEAVVHHKDKAYEIVVAEDGTLVEKVLVIDDEEVDLSACPAPVKATLQEHARGGMIRDITRSSGIGRPTYEAEVEIMGKVYAIEVAENGLLISISLEAAAE
jgi:hypothetical protein